MKDKGVGRDGKIVEAGEDFSVEELATTLRQLMGEFGEDLVVADRAADHDGQIVALPDTW